MIAADTNVVVRLLVRDDDRQTAAAMRLIDETVSRGETCLLTDAVLCEIEWVLETVYAAAHDRIAESIEQLLHAPVFEFEDRDLVRAALEAYRRRDRSDFSDSLIGARAAKAGATTTYTFDRKLRKSAWFTVL